MIETFAEHSNLRNAVEPTGAKVVHHLPPFFLRHSAVEVASLYRERNYRAEAVRARGLSSKLLR